MSCEYYFGITFSKARHVPWLAVGLCALSSDIPQVTRYFTQAEYDFLRSIDSFRAVFESNAILWLRELGQGGN